MFLKLYFIILIYFLFGGVLTFIINRKKSTSAKKKNWTKYIIYFFIVNSILLGTIYNKFIFLLFAIIIVLFGFYEIIKNFLIKKEELRNTFFAYSLFIFLLFSTGFILFSFSGKEEIIFTYFLVTVLDALSQLSGQLFGKRKIFPKISPNKTLEGVVGGVLMTIFSAVLIRKLIEIQIFEAIILGMIICIGSISGDLLASFYKRKLKIKDYSNFIPGHGGFLDRFDSLIVTSSLVFAFLNLTGF